EASDGAFVLGVGTDRQFERLAAMLGRPEWASGPWATNAERVRGRRDLEAALAAIFREAPREPWVARCRAVGIPAGPVRGPVEALTSETARALGSVVEAEGRRFVASPIRVEGAPA